MNTPDLLKDIIPNMRASESISPSIITIFGSLLAEVVQRATDALVKMEELLHNLTAKPAK